MAEKGRRKRTLDAVAGLAEQAAKDAGEGERPLVWVREDGAYCVGNECIVFKPGSGESLDVEINRNRGCDVEGLASTIFDTIGRGGDTTFKVQGHLEAEAEAESK